MTVSEVTPTLSTRPYESRHRTRAAELIAPAPIGGTLRTKEQGARALIKLGGSLLLGRVAQHRVFGHLDDDVWFAVNTSASRRFPVLQRVLPGLPDPAIQVEFIGSSGDSALEEAFRAYQLIRAVAMRAGHPISRQSTILDFGCGWGRTLRFFMRDVPASQLYGVDVMPLAIELCRKTNRWCQFSLVPPLPPSNLPSNTFDLIYLYSVFSHLSEEAHRRWLDEFHRLLRPGGLLFATTWQREYIERCERARQGDTRWTHPGSLSSFVGTHEWLEKYDRGEFCHSPVGGSRDTLASNFYGETCIPEAYVRRSWSDKFRIVDYLEADGQWLSQNLIVAERL